MTGTESALLGRTRELARFESILAAGTPTVLVVEGASGIGKTALVEHFLAVHPDLSVSVAVGASWESQRPFGIVEQLLRDAVPVAEPAEPADVAREFLASSRASIVVVDDAQWADIESLQALTSAVRLADRLLLVVLVARDAPDPQVRVEVRKMLSDNRNRLFVGPLDPADVCALAREVAGVELSAPIARQLAEHTSGNPRHLTQVLDETPRAAWEKWQPVLPVPKTVAALVSAELESCGHAARALLESAAVLGWVAPFDQVAELAGVSEPIEALDEAQRHIELRIREQRGIAMLEFGSPLICAAVYRTLGPVGRRDVHARAARIVVDEGERLTHLAAANPLPDATLADDFDKYASSRAAEGAWSAVADALIKSSRLSVDRADRERRLIRAVDALVGAGNLPQAKEFVPEIESFGPTPLRDAVLGYLAILLGRSSEAGVLLGQAWAQCDASGEPETAAMICQRRVLDALGRWHGPDLVEWSRRAIALVDPTDPAAVESAAILGLGLAASGSIDDAKAAYESLSAKVVLGAQAQRFRMGKGWLDLALDDPESARHELESAVPTAFRMGSARISLWAGAWLARTQFALGTWDDAIRSVDHAVAQLDHVGLDLVRPLVHWTGAQIHALRGDWPSAHEHLRHGGADSHDYQIMFIPSCLARAQCAEVEADYEGVIRALEPLVRLEVREGIDEPGFWPWPDVYANALVMAGRVDEADQFLRPHEEKAAKRGHRSAMARLGYVRGRIAGAGGDIAAASEIFETALRQLESLPLQYDRARINFAYGQTLRRAGKRRDADAVLQAARAGYAALGATSYVARCDRELKAGGLNVKRSSDPIAELTPQEQAVAALIAAGSSNKEAAEELFLSVKTVQYHLTRVYAKLGIRSRSELGSALMRR